MSGRTSTASKAAYNAKAYKRYQVYLRTDDDADLIEYIEQLKAQGKQTSDIFRTGLEQLKKEGE